MSKKVKLTTFEIVLFGVLGALTFAAKLVMSPLPNIEPASLMIMLFAVTFGWKALYPTGLYVAMEVLYYGIHRLCGKAAPVVSTAICAFGILRYRLGWGSLPWNLDVALVAQFFFHLGFCFKGLSTKLGRFDSMKFLPKLLLSALLMGLNLVLGFVCIRVSGASMDMSVGWYGNVLILFPSALCGIASVILFAQIIDWKWLTWLGRHTMVIFAWHSRIVIVACQHLYANLGMFQGTDLLSKLGYSVCTFAVILVLLIPATHLIERSRVHTYYGL